MWWARCNVSPGRWVSNIFILRSMKRHNINLTNISCAIRYKLLFTTLSEYHKLRDKKGKLAVVRLFGDLLFFFPRNLVYPVNFLPKYLVCCKPLIVLIGPHRQTDKPHREMIYRSQSLDPILSIVFFF